MHLFSKGPHLGNLEEGSSTGDFERRMKGTQGVEHLSLKRLHGGGLGGALSLGTLEDILGRSPDVGIFLHGGPFSCLRGTWYVAGGGSYNRDYDG